MRKDIIITGSGGQGVIMLSVLLANAYGISEGYEISQTQSYGAQARGGASQSSLIVSDEPIDYIEVEKADVLVAFNELALKKYLPKAKEDAMVFVDSTFIGEEVYADLPQKVYAIDAAYIAEHQFRPFMLNVVMMGFMAAKLGDVKFSSLEQAIASELPSKAYEQNVAALRAGYERGID